MQSPVHFLPIVTTLVCIPFAVILYRHWRRKPSSLYLAWWMLGVITYGVGTITESLTTIMGWDPVVFKAWYISGALLGGVPLAQGTVYLLFSDKFAHRTSVILIAFISIASICILASPMDLTLVETYRLSGRVLEWQWVRLFSPFINIYAVLFLVGGAVFSAWKYAKSDRTFRSRMWGNIFIATGAILPGIGGSSARAGYIEILYITELMGILLIWLGYHTIVTDRSGSLHVKQRVSVQEIAATDV